MRHFPESEKLVRCGCFVLHNLSLDDKNVPHLLAFGVARPLQRAAQSQGRRRPAVCRLYAATLARRRGARGRRAAADAVCVGVLFPSFAEARPSLLRVPDERKTPPDAIDATRYETQAHGRQSMKIPLFTPPLARLHNPHRCARTPPTRRGERQVSPQGVQQATASTPSPVWIGPHVTARSSPRRRLRAWSPRLDGVARPGPFR